MEEAPGGDPPQPHRTDPAGERADEIAAYYATLRSAHSGVRPGRTSRRDRDAALDLAGRLDPDDWGDQIDLALRVGLKGSAWMRGQIATLAGLAGVVDELLAKTEKSETGPPPAAWDAQEGCVACGPGHDGPLDENGFCRDCLDLIETAPPTPPTPEPDGYREEDCGCCGERKSCRYAPTGLFAGWWCDRCVAEVRLQEAPVPVEPGAADPPEIDEEDAEAGAADPHRAVETVNAAAGAASDGSADGLGRAEHDAEYHPASGGRVYVGGDDDIEF